MKKSASRKWVKAALHSDKLIIVIKIGTSSLIRAEHGTLNLTSLAQLADTVKALHMLGHHVVIVSSGAVGVGCQSLRLTDRPSQLAKKQALAAVGQVRLMRFYEDFFSALGLTCAQVLLTLDNLANRAQYNNARNTFTELLNYRVIPIVNENDTVAVQELRFGDNDTLSAQVACLVGADWLFLLTDVHFLYTSNPKLDPNAEPIYVVEDITHLQADTQTKGTQWGTGGMATKLTAGRIATAAGCSMAICHSEHPSNMLRVLAGEEKVGTTFLPVPNALRGRKRWILSVPVRGAVWLDAGAVKAVKDKHKSLFSAGITQVHGNFNAQDSVSICDWEGVEFARGLCNFNYEDVRKVKGKQSCDFDAQLGYHQCEEVVHRDNLVLLTASEEDAYQGRLELLRASSMSPDNTTTRAGSTPLDHPAIGTNTTPSAKPPSTTLATSAATIATNANGTTPVGITDLATVRAAAHFTTAANVTAAANVTNPIADICTSRAVGTTGTTVVAEMCSATMVAESDIIAPINAPAAVLGPRRVSSSVPTFAPNGC